MGIQSKKSFEKIIFVCNYALRICDFGGQWSVTLNNRGWSNKANRGADRAKIKQGW